MMRSLFGRMSLRGVLAVRLTRAAPFFDAIRVTHFVGRLRAEGLYFTTRGGRCSRGA